MRDTIRRLELHRVERRRSEDDRRIVGKAVAFFRKAEHAPVEFPVAVFVMINGDGVGSRSRHGQAGDGYRHFRLYPETREFPTPCRKTLLVVWINSDGYEIGRAHVCTPVTNAHIVCRLLLDKKKTTKDT